MRPLKFRAWDKVSKKFLRPWPDGFAILGETTCFDLIGMQLKERNHEKTILEMLDDVIITQFTSLHDRHGKEIWEGDKVNIEIIKDEWRPDEIIFSQGMFRRKSTKTPIGWVHPLCIEVIGNIFEGGE